MPETTVFLLDIIDSNSLHRPVRKLHQDNGISAQINQSLPGENDVPYAKLLRTNLYVRHMNSAPAYWIYVRH
jgi:hypothetical protein